MNSDGAGTPCTLTVAGHDFLCSRMPLATAPLSAEAWIGQALASSAQPAPALIYWDAKLSNDSGRLLQFGRGGLDPILCTEHDLSPCVAVLRQAYDRMLQRNALQKGESLARAVSLLARSPATRSLWIKGLTGELSLPSTPGAPRAAVHTDAISLVLLVDGSPAVEPFLAALKGQAISSQLDLVVISAGLDSLSSKTLARALEAATVADPRLKVRRYGLTGEPSRPYMANIGIGLASGEAVIVADRACVPVSATAVQQLADWSLSGDIVATCPRILFEGRLLAAGMGLQTEAEAEASLVLWSDPLLTDGFRTAPAPAPWFFAVRRSAWLAAGGLRGVASPSLWTAELAYGHAPRGRTVLIGSEIAEWTGVDPPVERREASHAHRRLQSSAVVAVCNPDLSSPLSLVSLEAARAASTGSVDGPAFSDPFPSSAAMRLLVFADDYGASQSIAFVDGLAGPRSRSDAAVRIVPEAAFHTGAGKPALDPESIVEAQFSATHPTIVIVSRLGHAGAWRAVEAVARRHGVPIVAHIDDDLLDLPAVLGTERYRTARNPRRIATLSKVLTSADRVLAATPALARRLKNRLPEASVFPMRTGCAGRPSGHVRRQGERPITICYMGSASHDYDLEMIVPALNAVCAGRDDIRFVLFGSIAEQPAAGEMTFPVERHAMIRHDYTAFRRHLASLQIDIGLAPLRRNAFNRAKTPTKWVEYAEAGAVVLASKLEPYLPMISAGAAMGAETHEWEHALRRMVEDEPLRIELAERANAVLAETFSWSSLESDVLAGLLGDAPAATASMQIHG